MFCRFFILRPVLSAVLSIVILIGGIVAIYVAPIAQYPEITPPSISITATFPGATSETLANTVAAPLEDQLSGVSHMIYMYSTSENAANSVTVTIYFDIGTDIHAMMAEVLNRINTASPQLPVEVTQQGIVVKEAAPDIFLLIDMYSAKNGYPDLVYLSNYVQRYLSPIVTQINGVGSVTLIGNRSFAMRVWLDPKKLNYYSLSVHDVITAINEQNSPFAIGLINLFLN